MQGTKRAILITFEACILSSINIWVCFPSNIKVKTSAGFNIQVDLWYLKGLGVSIFHTKHKNIINTYYVYNIISA